LNSKKAWIPVVGDQIDCIKDWLHGGNIADIGKKSGDRSGNSGRHVDCGSGKAQGIGAGESGIKASQRDIA